ncbi:MAG: hypothetical protein AAFR87_15425 [Bacteroidota bacterium]
MKVEGLFIEYLISGGIAFIWIYPTTQLLNIPKGIFDFDIKLLLVAIPITYVIGMFIDFIASKILKKEKIKAKAREFNAKKLDEHSFYDSLFELASANSFLIEHLVMRETRVRSARGVFVNFLLASLAIPLYFFVNQKLLIGLLAGVFLIGLTIMAFYIFRKMVGLSYQFQASMIKKFKRDN